jgi:hypothetical protein
MILIPQIVESMYNYTSLADTAAEDLQYSVAVSP